MGVSIGYRPVKNDFQWVAGGSTFHGILDNLFGIPCELSEVDIPKLQGIAACGNEGASELIEAIYKYERIQVSAQW